MAAESPAARLRRLAASFEAAARRTVPAANRVLTDVRRQALETVAKAASAVYNRSAKDIAGDLTVVVRNGSLAISGSTLRPRANKFHAEITEAGLLIEVIRGKPEIVPRGFFLPGSRAKGFSVARKGNAKYPTRLVTGPSAFQMLRDPKVGPVALVEVERIAAAEAVTSVGAILRTVGS